MCQRASIDHLFLWAPSPFSFDLQARVSLLLVTHAWLPYVGPSGIRIPPLTAAVHGPHGVHSAAGAGRAFACSPFHRVSNQFHCVSGTTGLCFRSRYQGITAGAHVQRRTTAHCTARGPMHSLATARVRGVRRVMYEGPRWWCLWPGQCHRGSGV